MDSHCTPAEINPQGVTLCALKASYVVNIKKNKTKKTPKQQIAKLAKFFTKAALSPFSAALLSPWPGRRPHFPFMGSL